MAMHPHVVTSMAGGPGGIIPAHMAHYAIQQQQQQQQQSAQGAPPPPTQGTTNNSCQQSTVSYRRLSPSRFIPDLLRTVNPNHTNNRKFHINPSLKTQRLQKVILLIIHDEFQCQPAKVLDLPKEHAF